MYIAILLSLEELAQFALAIYFLRAQPISFSWWIWPLLFLAPDLGQIGYAINPLVGSITYNITHHKMVAILLIAAGYYFDKPVLTLAGLIIFGHSSFDRMFGMGLKYPDIFQHTHLNIFTASLHDYQ